MPQEQIEDIKELLVCIQSDIEYITKLYTDISRKLEENKIASLKMQNQIAIASHLIPETEKTINRIKGIIDNLEREEITND